VESDVAVLDVCRIDTGVLDFDQDLALSRLPFLVIGTKADFVVLV
jgi:hypothetical protein